MNGRVAKKIRNSVYGSDLSPRDRKYKEVYKMVYWIVDRNKKPVFDREGVQKSFTHVTLVADERRRRYKFLKKAYARGAGKKI